MPSKQKDNDSKVEPKEPPKIFQGIKTERDDGIGGVAATMVWSRNKTPASVREFYQDPRGLNFKKPGVGQQKKRGYIIPETERESKKKEPFEGTVAGAMYGWGCKFPNSKQKSREASLTDLNNTDGATTYIDAEIAVDTADKLQEKDDHDLEKQRSSSTARGTQTTASLRTRNKPANKKVENKSANKKNAHDKDKDKEGELWKMSKFTKNAKPVITTH